MHSDSALSSVSNEHRDNLEEGDHLYKYKNKVTIPMLGMVDDELSINYCGLDSALSTESDIHCMQDVSEWKYLGDILSSNSKQDANIKERISRASGAAKETLQMLDDLCLGDFYFQGANILRSSLFLSSLISNCEAWVNLSAKNISDLESLDEKLLRDILSAHAKTPKELLYLETGSLPVSYVIKSRRLNLKIHIFFLF